jgi:8-oxo-dGTP diphosphatase
VDFRQLAVFDDPGRDDRGWVLSVGHVAAMPSGELPADARLVDVVDGAATADLLFDHALIVERAVQALREQYGSSVDPNGLGGRQFTVLDLRRLYEAVFGHLLPKDSFRRYVQPHLEDTGALNSEVVGRPAAVFRRKPDSPLPPAARSFFLTGGR